MKDLGTLGGDRSSAADINNSGQVVGWSYTSGSQQEHAFLYSNGSMKDLGTLGRDASYATAINDSGQIVGDTADAEGWSHAFLYSGGSMMELIISGYSSRASDIDNSGRIVGDVYAFEEKITGFLYSGGSLINLGTFSGLTMNDLGQIAGTVYTGSETIAYLYSGGKYIDLGSLGGRFAVASDMNDAGQIVGKGWNPAVSQGTRAFLYSSGSMIDLNNALADGAGWTLLEAKAINNRGQIVGIGTFNGQTRAFLLTPAEQQLVRRPPESGSLDLSRTRQRR